ncbi:hypothetical protein Tco_1519300, partial [Tanacetum coccineum]
SGKSLTVAKLLSSVNISSGKIYTNSGKSTLAVGMNMTNSGNALEHFIPNNLGLGDLSHTRMTIELADRTIKQPKGIAANVLVRIGKFVFPLTLSSWTYPRITMFL